MKAWPNIEAMISYYTTEGFIVGDMECLKCGFKTMALHPPGTDQYKLECRRCGAKESNFEVVNPI